MNSHPSPEGNEAVTACGGRINDPNQYPSALHHGERVYFCTRACLRAFEATPEPFMAGEIEHPSEGSGVTIDTNAEILIVDDGKTA